MSARMSKLNAPPYFLNVQSPHLSHLQLKKELGEVFRVL